MTQARSSATEAMLSVSRTMTAMVARTLGEVAADITVPQLRVLVLLNSRGSMNLRTIAEHLDVNASNASRTCDQLVAAGMLVREVHDEDRRQVRLILTGQGSDLVDQLMEARRRIIDGVVGRMDVAEQEALAAALQGWAAAVESAPPEETIGFPDGRIIPWLL